MSYILNRKIIKAIFYFLFYCTTVAWTQNRDTSKTLSLNEGWEFSKAGTNEWLSAIVPGTVHQDLISHKLLPDPFYGTNESKIQWVENEDWEYRTSFIITEEQLKYDNILLLCNGLDTYADVYLNGSLLLKADNMFIGYKVPIKSVLKKGINRLHVYFHSPIKQTLPQYNSNGFNYPADNDHHDKHLSVFTRKAPYSYGWDWGIRMVTSGIWRPISLYFYNVATISDYYIRQTQLTDNIAHIYNELTIENANKKVPVKIKIYAHLKDSLIAETEKNVLLSPGNNTINLPIEINHPIRWMPNGWGEPTLYNFTAQIICNGQIVSNKSHRIGLRTIRVVNNKDKDGESFYFEVNGIPMFAKGANYIPQDPMLPSVTKERYRNLFNDIHKANMNIIRVWGGGIYEDDYFYDLADENGILIWQDFMFACTPYPSDPTFMKRVEVEADYNIKRLRNHASLAMWCGNNEILEALKYWGYQKKITPEIYQELLQSYERLFHQLLPSKVKELDSNRFYLHSSPYFANWGQPDSWSIGDSHNWGIWYGKKPFESSDEDIPRFMSEFGFQSFPEMKTISTFASPKDYQIESEVMTAHQKSSIGNSLIRTYMERDYIVPKKFEDFIYVGLLLQGKGIRHGLEAHRRNRPYCMGTMYWQLNDSWPVVSWSSIDYYGNWKALHYEVQRAFEPVLINPIQKKDSLHIYLISDLLTNLNQASLEIKIINFEGKQLGKKKTLYPLNIRSNTSQCIYTTNISQLISQEYSEYSFLQLTLKSQKAKILAETIHFFRKPKDLALPQTKISSKIKVLDGKYELILSSPKLAKDVFIEIPLQGAHFSDNFFDLLPGKQKKIIIESPLIKKGEKPILSIKHLRNIYP